MLFGLNSGLFANPAGTLYTAKKRELASVARSIEGEESGWAAQVSPPSDVEKTPDILDAAMNRPEGSMAILVMFASGNDGTEDHVFPKLVEINIPLAGRADVPIGTPEVVKRVKRRKYERATTRPSAEVATWSQSNPRGRFTSNWALFGTAASNE